MMEDNGLVQLTPVIDLKQEPSTASAPGRELRAGDLCPRCGEGRLDYDGVLNLTCPKCGYTLGGGCT